MSGKIVCCCLFILAVFGCNTVFAGIFDTGETQVVPSPAEGRYLDFKGTEKVLDFDVA